MSKMMFKNSFTLFVTLIITINVVVCQLTQPPPKQQSLEELLGEIFNEKGPAVPEVSTQKIPTQITTTTFRPAIPTVSGGQPEVNPCPDGSECVQFYQCEDGDVVTDGSGIFDVRIDAYQCPNSLQTCCSLKSENPKIPKIEIVHECGIRNSEGIGFRITGAKDNEAQFAEFPNMIAVLKEEKALDKILNVYQCGGSLIAPNVVLTVAHCVYLQNPDDLKIRAGEWDTKTKDEIFAHQDRDVQEIIIHESFLKKNLFNDIALLILKTPVEIAENVNTMCLPNDDEQQFNGKHCFVSGWGKNEFGKEGVYQVILKRIELPMIEREECQKRLRTTRLGRNFKLDKSFVCAGGEAGRDTCTGDGGSPLMCPIPGKVNRYQQAGMVAWGIGCNDPVPAAYVNVAHFRHWIDEKLSERHIPSSSYIA